MIGLDLDPDFASLQPTSRREEAVMRVSRLMICMISSYNLACLLPPEEPGDEVENVAESQSELAACAPVVLNDLAILFPLPASSSALNLLLRPRSTGARGALLPAAIFGQLPALTSDPATQASAYEKLRVVSIRFDPCHTGLDPHGSRCEPQIRLQLQLPEAIGVEDPQINTLEGDSAVHLIYSLDRSEFRRLVAQLVAARQASGMDLTSAPVDVHPIIVSQGLAGAYAQRIERLILKYAGASNLTRVAFSAVRLRQTISQDVVSELRMGHFDVRAGQLIPRAIGSTSGTGPQHERFVESIDQSGAPRLVVTTTPEGSSVESDDLAILFDTNAFFGASPARAQQAFDATLRIDNPLLHNLETIDCVSCHSSTSSRSVLVAFHGLDPDAPRPGRYTSTQNLDLRRTVLVGFETNIMFGYKARLAGGGARVSLTQRLVNETAESVAHLNAGGH